MGRGLDSIARSNRTTQNVIGSTVLPADAESGVNGCSHNSQEELCMST
jgi:hypothetical protein